LIDPTLIFKKSPFIAINLSLYAKHNKKYLGPRAFIASSKNKKIKNPANYESQFPRHQHNPALALGEAR